MKHLTLWIFLSLVWAFSLGSCATNPKIQTTNLSSRDVPGDFQDFRIVFLSDIHINALLPEEYFSEVVQKVLDMEPDLVLLGGDYVDSHTTDLHQALELLRPLGELETFAVLGNHDHWENPDTVTSILLDLGIEVLVNESVEFQRNEQRIILCGVDDPFSGRHNVEETFRGIESGDFTILLSHSPEIYGEIGQDQRVDLMLSGHTHGGQVTFFGLWAPILPLKDRRFWRGEYQSEHNRLIISNGIGVYKYPVRVFAPPKIDLIILSSSE